MKERMDGVTQVIKRYNDGSQWIGYPAKDVRVEELGIYKVTLTRQMHARGTEPLWRVEVRETWMRVQSISDLSKAAGERLFNTCVEAIRLQIAKEAMGLSKGSVFDIARVR